MRKMLHLMRGVSAGIVMAMFYGFIVSIEAGEFLLAAAMLGVCWLNAGNFRTLTLRLQARGN
jgi:hypothetical protein